MAYKTATIVQPGKSNTKIGHGLENYPDLTIFTVSLASSDTSGHNLCPKAMRQSAIDKILSGFKSVEVGMQAVKDYAMERGLSLCTLSCVTNRSGKGAAEFVREPRKNLSRWYVEDRPSFKAAMIAEFQAKIRRGGSVACRPNVDSDVAWERTVPEMFDLPMTFWDYTKVSKRLGKTPSNYHLTYSVSDGTTAEDWKNVHASGCNIAVVFNTIWQPGGKAQYHKFGVLPTWFTDPTGKRWRVVDGDKTDLRFTDPKNVCVGLRLKGRKWERAIAIWSGFARAIPTRLRKLFKTTHPSKAIAA